MRIHRPLLCAGLLCGALLPTAAAGDVPQPGVVLNASSRALAPSVFYFAAPVPPGFGVPQSVDGGHGELLTHRANRCTTRLLLEAGTGKTGGNVTAVGLAARLRRAAARAQRSRPGIRARVITPVLPFASAGTLRSLIAASPSLVSPGVRGEVFGVGGARVRVQYTASLIAPLDAAANPGQRIFTLLLAAEAQPRTAACAAQTAALGAHAGGEITLGGKLTQTG